MYQHVLVGSDGSTTAQKAVRRAVEVATTDGAKLTILSAGRHAADVVAAEAARHSEATIEIGTMAVDGDPATALIDEVSAGNYDLLVVGNKGLAGVRRLLPLGSVPSKISHHPPCSLLVVKTT